MNIDRILEKADEIQEEFHRNIEFIKKTPEGSKLSYDSIKDVMFMLKIAELSDRIKELEEINMLSK